MVANEGNNFPGNAGKSSGQSIATRASIHAGDNSIAVAQEGHIMRDSEGNLRRVRPFNHFTSKYLISFISLSRDVIRSNRIFPSNSVFN